MQPRHTPAPLLLLLLLNTPWGPACSWLSEPATTTATATKHPPGPCLPAPVCQNLVSLNFNQEAREADFRYNLVRVRENAESGE